MVEYLQSKRGSATGIKGHRGKGGLEQTRIRIDNHQNGSGNGCNGTGTGTATSLPYRHHVIPAQIQVPNQTDEECGMESPYKNNTVSDISSSKPETVGETTSSNVDPLNGDHNARTTVSFEASQKLDGQDLIPEPKPDNEAVDDQ